MSAQSDPPGFFIPYRYHDRVEPFDYPACAQILASHERQFSDVIELIESHHRAFQAFGGAPPAPRFEQQWFARLDIAACYSLVQEYRPRRIVEVGSGHSTRVIKRACLDGAIETELTCIDPKPRADLLNLKLEHLPMMAHLADLAIFDRLQAGDILFIDSSHLAQPGTDVDYLFNIVLPRLAAGVIVHVHDVFLPDAYPKAWAWRGYNEQLLVAVMLTSLAYRPLFASHYIQAHSNLIAADSTIHCLPWIDETPETSVWLEKLNEPIR